MCPPHALDCPYDCFEHCFAHRRIARYWFSSGAPAGLPRSHASLLARSQEALYDTARACNARGAEVVTFGVDLADASALNRTLDSIAEYPVDLIVNNAGFMAEEALPWETDPEAWWRTQEINVRAPYLISHALVPHMIERGGGRIVDLSSGAAVWDADLASSYYVSKTALLRFAGSLHEAGAQFGLRVFSVAPGVVRTDMTANRVMHEGVRSGTIRLRLRRLLVRLLMVSLTGLRVRRFVQARICLRICGRVRSVASGPKSASCV